MKSSNTFNFNVVVNIVRLDSAEMNYNNKLILTIGLCFSEVEVDRHESNCD